MNAKSVTNRIMVYYAAINDAETCSKYYADVPLLIDRSRLQKQYKQYDLNHFALRK